MASEVSSFAERRGRRVLATVAACALLAAGLVVGLTQFEMRGQSTTIPDAVTTPQPGYPPIQLEFGLRPSAETSALARAEKLLDRKQDPEPGRAAAIFRRYHSLQARLGLLFATWRGPSSLGAVKTLVDAHPNDPAALLNLGWADFQAGRDADAVAAWQKLAREYPDSPYGVDAQDALHSGPSGLPFLQLDFQPPSAIGRLPAAQQLVALARAAAGSDPHAKLLYGAFLWNDLRRPISAERQFQAAAALAPEDPLARTAAAVGLFTKADPVRAFAHLGPLTATFPKSAVVRFELGMLLLWRNELKKAATQLRLAVADGPRTVYATTAKQLLARISRQ